MRPFPRRQYTQNPLRASFFEMRGLESCGDFFSVLDHWLTPFVRECFCICAPCCFDWTCAGRRWICALVIFVKSMIDNSICYCSCDLSPSLSDHKKIFENYFNQWHTIAPFSIFKFSSYMEIYKLPTSIQFDPRGQFSWFWQSSIICNTTWFPIFLKPRFIPCIRNFWKDFNDLTGAVTGTSHTYGLFLFNGVNLGSVGCTKIFVLVLLDALKESVVFGIDTIPIITGTSWHQYWYQYQDQ